MLSPSTLLAAAAIFGSVAQADYHIDPNSVALSQREYWCSNQVATCGVICRQFPPGTTITNTCDPKKLTYGCLCGNNQQPNVSEYSETVPYFVCLEYGNQCVAACNNDNLCQSDCREKNPCGATNPVRVNSTATAPAGPTSTGPGDDAIFTGTPGSSSKKGAAPSLDIGRAYGLCIVLGGMFVGFAML